MTGLQDSKKGRKLLEGKSNEPDGPSLAAQLAEKELGGKAFNSTRGFVSVSSMLAHGDKLGATQAIYDSTRMGGRGNQGRRRRRGEDDGARSLRRPWTSGRTDDRSAVGVFAGEAAGFAAGAAMAAAISVIGWAIDGALAAGFGISMIIDAVKKHKAQQAFDHNVDPVLDQFGI